MSPERFRQVRNLFEAALEREPDDRQQFVIEAVGSDEDLKREVLRMLEAHGRRVTFFDGTLTASPELRTDPRRLEGRRLGPFEILSEIGHGGMGTVYLARRADGVFEQRAAVKVVTPGTSTEEVIRRFKQERAILAALDHINIARIYDGGATDEGWPYFVMEYVNGKRIDEWCNDRRLNTSDRIRLFQIVCKAVQYAHQHGVVHRDLKPANVLVTTEGTVKLLDFGIAKVLRSETQDPNTRTLIGMMTPEYASPEQFRGDDTTQASDVYALGVILYELLTGRRPYRMKSRIFREFVRVVCEEQPVLASRIVTEPYEQFIASDKSRTVAPAVLSATREGTPIDLRRRLTGDLDSILSKTLQKSANDRYRSAEQLSADLDRHLEGRPILAAPPGWIEQAARFISRHRLQVVLGFVLLLASLAGAIRVQWTALAYFGAGLMLLGLWAASTNAKLGAVIHRSLYGKGTVVAVAVLLIANAALIYWSDSVDIAHQRFDRFTAVFYLMSLVWLVGGAISWFQRERWTGKLLLSRIFPTKITAYAVILCFSLIDVAYSTITSGAVAMRPAIVAAMFTALILWTRRVLSRFEIRDRGIVFRGDFYSWLQMDGYSWEGNWSEKPPPSYCALPDGTECLHLRVPRKSIFFRPFVRIPVLKEDRVLVDTLVKQNLCPAPVESDIRLLV